MQPPAPCNTEIYETGRIALYVALKSQAMEAWVARVRERSGQRVDWHYVGGRAVVKFIGDMIAVRDAILAEAVSLVEAVLVEDHSYDLDGIYTQGTCIARGYDPIPNICVPSAAWVLVCDIDQETGAEIPESAYATVLDAFVEANKDDPAVSAILAEMVKDESIETATLGGGASVITRVRRLM